MNEAFKELEDAEQPLYPQQQVQWLLCGVKNDGIQVQTTLGIIHDRYLTDFDSACLTLSRTVSTRFTNVENVRNKRSIGAVSSSSRRGGRGLGRARHGGNCGGNNGGGGRHHVVMNGVDVTDILVSRNFTSDKWEKLKLVGSHTYMYQRRKYLSGCGGCGSRGVVTMVVETAIQIVTTVILTEPLPQCIATTDMVEYNSPSSTANNSNTSLSSNSDHGGRNAGGRFGPQRENRLLTPPSVHNSQVLLGHQNISTIYSSNNRQRSIHAIETTDTYVPGTITRCEMDSHADTCAVGPNFRIDELTGEHFDVTPLLHRLPANDKRSYRKCLNCIHSPNHWRDYRFRIQPSSLER